MEVGIIIVQYFLIFKIFFCLMPFPALLPEKEKEPQISRWVPTDGNRWRRMLGVEL
jgi:hypothetical protein